MSARCFGAMMSVAFLVGCQPQARRLLMLDEALTQGAELEATARPWELAGYSVEYRQYYPHLTRDDLHRYRVVMVLGGHRPLAATDALDAGDLAILTEWTLRGGVVVLGYPPGESGTFDRWLMNRWLAWSGAGISIGDFPPQNGAAATAPPQARAVLTSGLRGTGLTAFPVGTTDPLLVTDDAQVIARTGEGALTQSPGTERAVHAGVAIVAASRVADGLVIVVSRPVLDALGRGITVDRSANAPSATAGTQAFLVALARWTRRPAEWSHIPTAGPRVPLRLGDGPLPVIHRSPRERPPEGVTVERLAGRDRPVPPKPANSVPTWITRQGVRGLQADFPSLSPGTPSVARLAALDSLATLLDAGAFNALITDAHVASLADSTRVQRWERDALRNAWQQVTERLQPTSVRWIPLVLPRGLRTPTDSAAPVEDCAMDPVLWSRLTSGARVLARLAARYTDLIPAIGFGLDETTRRWSSAPFCDATWQAGLGALARNSALTRQRLARLTAVPLAARYDSLLNGGLLAAYDSGVTRVVVQRAAALRADLSRIRRTLLFAIVLDRSPSDWFTRSLVRGLSTPGTPVLLFSPDRRARERVEAIGDVNLVHAVRLDPGELLSGGAAGLSHAVFNDQDGFWLGPAESFLAGPSDSLARQVRRLTKER